MSSKKILVGLMLILLAVMSPVLITRTAPVEITLEPFLSGLDEPVNLIATGVQGDDRLFVVQRGGKILVVDPEGTVRAKPFLDISGRVDTSAGRSGMFGLAFHPDYATNGTFYVHYIHLAGEVRTARLSRFQVTDDPNVADPNSEDILLTVEKPVTGHYAGDIHFGPDGYLYFPQGDGNNVIISDRPQGLTTLLGKMNRINVDDKAGEGAADCKGEGSGHYSIPPSNPYAGSNQACDEIWAVGLRNPWRFSFDRQNGDLYLSDVGQTTWDEFNYAVAGTGTGRNYGWPCYEANKLFEEEQWAARGCDPGASFTFPVYSQAIGSADDCSIIGGYVYRGSRYPDLVGRYLMSDFCSGHLRDAVHKGGKWEVTLHDVTSPGAVSFGQGNNGELYLVNLNDNTVDRVAGEEGPVQTPTPTPTPGMTATPTPTPTLTNTPPPGASLTPTSEATSTLTATPTAAATITVTPNGTVTPPELDFTLYLPVVLRE